MTATKINLLNLTRGELIDFFLKLGEKSFRATQALKWMHQLGIVDFDSMTNFSKNLRQYLNNNTQVLLPQISSQQLSKDGTQKFLLKLQDNNYIETVFIPEASRGTLCISTQVGCPLQCAFCATGKQGFKRNLEVHEIIGQIWLATRVLTKNAKPHNRIITNVVLMGMGEPLLNFTNVIQALDLMQDDLAYGLSKYKVTLSTAGIIPEMQRLSSTSDVALAVSLHAPNDELRDILVPINKKYPLKDLLTACKNHYQDRRRKITFEYIMLAGINDGKNHARQLVKILSNIPCKINLIPANQVKNSEFQPSPSESIEEFRNILLNAGFNTITRKKRGDDIAAACGQLAGKNSRY